MEQCAEHGVMCEKISKIDKAVAIISTDVKWIKEKVSENKADTRYYLSLLISLSALAMTFYGGK
jgi:hypothetical protein